MAKTGSAEGSLGLRGTSVPCSEGQRRECVRSIYAENPEPVGAQDQGGKQAGVAGVR